MIYNSEERQRAESAVLERQAAEEDARRIEQDMMDQQQTYNENMKQLRDKMEDDKRQLAEDSETMLQSKYVCCYVNMGTCLYIYAR